MDVSADLTELGRTNVCVVCAGAKSILDIPRTLEYLVIHLPPIPPVPQWGVGTIGLSCRPNEYRRLKE